MQSRVIQWEYNEEDNVQPEKLLSVLSHWNHTGSWGCMWEIVFPSDLLGQFFSAIRLLDGSSGVAFRFSCRDFSG